MRILSRFGVVAAVILTGCKLSSDLPSSIPAGVVTATAVADGGGGHVVRPIGLFFNKVNVSIRDSRLAPDTCVDTLFTPLGQTPEPNVTNIDAGPSISVQTDLATGTLKPDTSVLGLITYVLPDSQSLPFTPGANMTVVVSGASNGFPAMTLTAPTAGPYTFGPIDTVPSGPLTITWSPAAGVQAAIDLSLQYSTDPGAHTANRQIYCSLHDDGSYDIPQRLAANWRVATADTRHLDSRRVLTSQQSVNFTQLVVNSQFFVSKSTFP